MSDLGGRPNKEVYIDGNLYLAKKPITLSNSIAVVLPKDWLDAASGGRRIKYLLVGIDSLAELTIRPYFDNLPAGQGDEDEQPNT